MNEYHHRICDIYRKKIKTLQMFPWYFLNDQKRNHYAFFTFELQKIKSEDSKRFFFFFRCKEKVYAIKKKRKEKFEEKND